MYLGKADVNTYDKGAGREFLVSDGHGSYCFSTVIGANTRLAHGLLVKKLDPKGNHKVLVSKLEETLFIGSKKYQLSTNRYKDLIYPDGFRYLQEYQASPMPSMLFVIHSALFRKSIFMPQGMGCTIVKYELIASPERVRFEVRPLMSHRDVQSPQASRLDFICSVSGRELVVNGGGITTKLGVTDGEWIEKPLWFDRVVYEQEENCQGAVCEDLWSPGFLQLDMQEGDSVYFVLCSSDTGVCKSKAEIGALEKETIQGAHRLVSSVPMEPKTSAIRDLVMASSHLVDEGNGGSPCIYSGYPSMKELARETFISMPGLLVSTGRHKVAEGVLNRWLALAEANDWVVPSEVDGDDVKFHGVDPGLWLAYSAQKLYEAADNPDAKEDLWRKVLCVIDRYSRPIDVLQLSLTDNGMLFLDSDDPSRHWMNGVVDGETVVARRGYLVEVNALWYNALRFAEQVCELNGDVKSRERYASMADMCGKSFKDTFWNKEGGYLYDWVDPSCKSDPSIRPNQILGVSLPCSPLDPVMGRSVLDVCWDELYTTYGLRTLEPKHDKFKGRQEGRIDQRIKAKFRGMAWPWLLGHFITAYLKFNPNRIDIGWIFMRPFNSHMRHGCLGGIAEFFDGIMPYKPHGDVLYSASLGEVLRVLQEDLLNPMGVA